MLFNKNTKVFVFVFFSLVTSLSVQSSETVDFANQKKVDDKDITYSSDGKPLNWKKFTKKGLGDPITFSCDHLTSKKEHDKCFKFNANKLFNDKKWRKNKYLKPVEDVLTNVENQVNGMKKGVNPYESSYQYAAIPSDFYPWWQAKVSQSLVSNNAPLKENLQSLIDRAMAHSTQIKVFSDVPIIRETAIYEAKGKFDVTSYIEAQWRDIDDPVGSTLTTGGDDRFLEDEWMRRVGLRKKFITGTEIDISKRWGVLENNSEFLSPNNQANTRFAITLSQPLLRGFGLKYNRSNITVAKIDSHIALDEYKRQIESHLLELVRAYWGLYLERGALLQQKKLVSFAEDMHSKMKQRRDFDVAESQVRNTYAKLLERRSVLVRTESAVRNAEAKVLALVNDPNLILNDQFEIIPSDAPIVQAKSMPADLAVALALANRPEVQQTFKQVRAGAIRAQVTQNELRPVFNLLVKFYRDGIAGDADTDLSSELALDEGDGSWEAGLVFEYPIGNTTQKARHKRKKAELRQLINQMRTTLETVILEVKVSTREVNTALRKMNAQFALLKSVNTNLQELEKRQSVDLSDGINGAVLLRNIMDAQEDVAAAELGFLQSQVSYNIALANLDRATGMLLQTTKAQPRYFKSSDYFDLPEYKIERAKYK